MGHNLREPQQNVAKRVFEWNLQGIRLRGDPHCLELAELLSVGESSVVAEKVAQRTASN